MYSVISLVSERTIYDLKDEIFKQLAGKKETLQIFVHTRVFYQTNCCENILGSLEISLWYILELSFICSIGKKKFVTNFFWKIWI